MKNLLKIFSRGLIIENPLLMLMIGLCSAVAVTTSVENAIGMGAAMTFVIVLAELVISLFRKLIPSDARIPIFIIVIAAFTTMIDLAMKAYFPALSRSLGVFIPLIVVNCIIMGRVEAYASKQPPINAVFDALGMGVGYTWVLVGIATFRELLGNGTLLDFQIMPESFQPILFFTLSPGGFMVFALFIALNLWLKKITGRKAGNTIVSETL
ncbi:MAG: electron transport complex subunit RsxE [Spirochaetes bacterium GWD1_61_31]|nr:MAG: electron transport complex subunit RsxE [Spirochaetes bacterium GWB1_60_80]OHD40235.1 MAG: electron transport complex subunit RsxE [Spirochaetes bacterium GWD1_61_31]OHD45718.1 MAG: electron transport complex subunit RsxE [Spirochaetes bacterium GWE1_60_18]OHD59881.1 MAG: electron transport complex subunit RsxE [Spirochaetes bacterium GWF1_60_12]HBO41976.1 electron transport complex subunit RsxE [Spirochaetaceae bacterium]